MPCRWNTTRISKCSVAEDCNPLVTLPFGLSLQKQLLQLIYILTNPFMGLNCFIMNLESSLRSSQTQKICPPLAQLWIIGANQIGFVLQKKKQLWLFLGLLFKYFLLIYVFSNWCQLMSKWLLSIFPPFLTAFQKNGQWTVISCLPIYSQLYTLFECRQYWNFKGTYLVPEAMEKQINF